MINLRVLADQIPNKKALQIIHLQGFNLSAVIPLGLLPFHSFALKYT